MRKVRTVSEDSESFEFTPSPVPSMFKLLPEELNLQQNAVLKRWLDAKGNEKMTPEQIAQDLNLSVEQVQEIMTEIQQIIDNYLSESP